MTELGLIADASQEKQTKRKRLTDGESQKTDQIRRQQREKMLQAVSAM